MDEIVPIANVALVKASEVPALLQLIRPAWQAKDLIDRVRRLIDVDPSSACQRLFNATIHDLREKIIIAGIDIARDAAKQHKLPPIEKPEDVEEYSPSKLIDLAHRIGFLTRPDWRRLSRCYEIRRDLEHEDDEYEAGVEDCIYIFQTCINVVLSKDPIHLIRVADVKDLIEQPNPAIPAPSLMEDYQHAPQPRQEEILKFLVAIALDSTKAELVRLNAFSFISRFSTLTHNPVKLTIALFLQEKITRSGPSRVVIRVAYVAGVLPYLKQSHLRDFFAGVHKELEAVGPHWKKYAEHSDLLRSFKEIGGFQFCPPESRAPILKWMILTYIGEVGGRTSFGNVREVFYSNTAAPLIEEIITESASLVHDDLLKVSRDGDVQRACYTNHIRRRLEALADLVDPPTVEILAEPPAK